MMDGTICISNAASLSELDTGSIQYLMAWFL